MRILKSIIICLMVLTMLIPLSSANASTHEYDHAFSTTYFNNAELQLGSPAPDGSWSKVISKYNQPRDIGTNPHRGVDLAIGGGKTVRAVEMGKVERIINDGSSAEAVTISINGTNKYVTYTHINPDGNLYEGKPVDKGDTLGTVLSGPNHLHIGVQTSLGADTHTNDDVWNSNAPYWRNISGWDYGSRLDYFAHEYFSSSNNFSIDGYAYDENGRATLESVKVYYKSTFESSWISSNMSIVSSTNENRWQYNLNGQYSSGTLVQIVVVGYRANMTDSYKWGIWPGYYKKPSDNISDWPTGFSTYIVEIY
jgi:hypothetical protein